MCTNVICHQFLHHEYNTNLYCIVFQSTARTQPTCTIQCSLHGPTSITTTTTQLLSLCPTQCPSLSPPVSYLSTRLIRRHLTLASMMPFLSILLTRCPPFPWSPHLLRHTVQFHGPVHSPHSWLAYHMTPVRPHRGKCWWSDTFSKFNLIMPLISAWCF